MKPVIVKKNQDTAKKSKTYARYEKLLSEIETRQQYTLNIREGLHKAHAKINEELLPLEKESYLLSRDYVIRLDELSTEIGLGKFNREWFESYMSDELDVLLDFFGHQDTVLSKLYEKYVGVSVDEIANHDSTQTLVASLSERFGFKVDAKEFLEKGEKVYFEEHKHEMANDFENGNNDFSENESSGAGQSKKKPKNGKAAVEDVQLAKDARSIYMRLIKKFHPDLEKDPAAHDHKNEIIKQVTKAYQENDFFTLLKLQITYLDDNEIDATKVADDMIKRYNKILQKQLDEITARIHEMHFTSGDVIEDLIDKNGKFSAQKLAARKRDIEKEISHLKLTLVESKKRTKGWFKDQISMMKTVVQQNMMEDIMSNMFNDFNF